ncbi:MAG: glycosyltransferase [Thermodesulfobacteriota bacterium]
MNAIFLSAAMIVRNEERFLRDCLESLKGVADEIVVVDTGSTDRTKEIAARYGARVFDFPWRDDFSAARNVSVDQCMGEWILFIDADERLGPIDKDLVRADLSRLGYNAFTLKYRPITWFTTFREFRVFRSDPRIRFEGIIHETVLPSVMRAGEEDGLAIGDSVLEIDHIGYDGEMGHKHRRNLPLLIKHVENNPDIPFLRYRLGSVLKALGDTEGAEREWRRTIETIRSGKDIVPRDCQPYYDLIRLLLEKGEDISGLMDEAVRLFPDNYLIMWARAMALMHGGAYDTAAEIFSELASINPENIEAGRISYDNRIFGAFSYEPMGTCYFKLGKLRESERCYSLALKKDPENREYQTKHKLLSALLKKQRTNEVEN